ncbi:MAG TPA: Trx7/PDZ domain-containing (seleno)protein, partial [Pirellulaceae bacterium]|nr:Trx7/PDZ domain-containing (seleno)protein [Pirellulaceae bacterium]
SGKPVLVVLRCIPCEECVKLDDDLVDNDEQLRPLLDKFVRVRLVSTNGLDLSLFQYDTDQSFAVFMLNADGTIYGRYGTRSDQKEWSNDVSIAGLTQALDGALVLHKQYPANKEALAAKRGAAPEFPVPEQFPTLKGKFGPTLDYQGNVVRSCIHCHQIGDAQRAYHLDKSGAIPEKVLFPYPHPKALGLILSPQERATVLRVDEGSPAAAAGFKPGDRILKLAGQPLLSIADVQWVLHNTPVEGGSLEATVARSTSELPIRVTLKLENGWRRRDDIAWRASSWELRRYALGGLYLKTIDDDLREELEIKPDTMALRAQHVGEYAPHDRAKRAGLRKGDIILSFDGRTDFARETDLLVYALAQYQSGKKFEIDVLRDGQRLKIQLPAGAK